jgi:hypothetical protein
MTMTIENITALRPKADDSTSIADAIAAAEKARDTASKTAVDRRGKAATALLTATDAEIDAAEAEAIKADRTVQRIEVILTELRPKLVEAQEREQAEANQILVDEAVRLDAAFVTAWGKHYTPLVEAAAKIAVAKRAADVALQSAQQALGITTGLGSTDLPSHEAALHRSIFAVVYMPRQQRRVELMQELAKLAPSEIARVEAEAVEGDRRDRESRATAEAMQKRREEVGRAQVAAEQAGQPNRTMPRGIERANVTITSAAQGA